MSQPTIVVACDGSDHSVDALALANAIAPDARIVAAYIYWSGHDIGSGAFALPPAATETYNDWLREAQERAAASLEKAVESGVVPRDRIETRVAGSASVARGLQDIAAELSADAIVVGSSQRGRVGQVLAGNIGERLLHGSPCAVAVAAIGSANQALDADSTLTVGFDGSEESRQALDHALDLGRRTGARVRVASVATPPVQTYAAGATGGYAALLASIQEVTREQLESAVEEADTSDVAVTAVLRTGAPTKELADVARDGSLLVLGSRGYGVWRRVLLGSVSGPLARTAPCSVLVLPRGVQTGEHPEPRASTSAAL